MCYKLLFVEDDETLSYDVTKKLQEEGYQVENAFDGFTGEKLIRSKKYNCILLDIDMNGKNGFQITKSVRNAGIDTPIILVTAYSDVEDRVQGLECGANDYLVKPFFFRELVARIRAVTGANRGVEAQKTTFVVADLVIDTSKLEAYRNNKPLKLTTRELALLSLLAKSPGIPVARQQLLKEIWGASCKLEENAVDVLVNLLRKKVDKPFSQNLIRTRKGFGYYLGTD